MAEYVRLIPKEGITLGQFTYKDLEDIPREDEEKLMNYFREDAFKDKEYVKARDYFAELKIEVQEDVRAISSVFCYLKDELVMMIRFMGYRNLVPQLSTDKSFVINPTAASNRYKHSKEIVEGACRLIPYLFEQGIIEQCGAVDWQKRQGNRWVRSKWCRDHSAEFMPRNTFVLKQISDDERLIVEIYDKTKLLKDQDELTHTFKTWRWPEGKD